MSKIIIVGGGIIGLMSAYYLVGAGADVILIDKTQPGTESSWAGGGIISPLYPWRHHHSVTVLANWSQQNYPKIIAKLSATTNIDAEFYQGGLLIPSAKDVFPALTWAETYKQDVKYISKAEIGQLNPNLNQDFNKALWLPNVASVRNPRLLKALLAYLLRQPNFKLLDNMEVTNFKIQAGGVTKVVTKATELKADKILLATGAWSGRLLLRLGAAVPIHPVKGQMLLFAAEPGLLQQIVLYRNHYLIPRLDGNIVVGSTLEHAGFDKSTTQQAYDMLYTKALEMLPALSKYKVTHHWAGLRPGTGLAAPTMDQVPGINNLYVCAGHYRNGLVLAPAAAKFITDKILGETDCFDPEPYKIMANTKELSVNMS